MTVSAPPEFLTRWFVEANPQSQQLQINSRASHTCMWGYPSCPEYICSSSGKSSHLSCMCQLATKISSLATLAHLTHTHTRITLTSFRISIQALIAARYFKPRVFTKWKADTKKAAQLSETLSHAMLCMLLRGLLPQLILHFQAAAVMVYAHQCTSSEPQSL